MIFDKNAYRIAELSKKLARTSEAHQHRKLQERIGRLKAHGPEYHVKYRTPLGKWRTERVPEKYRGKRGALRYEKLKVSEVETGAYDSPDARKATIETVCRFYLDKKMRGRGGYSAAKTLCGHIVRHIGRVLLKRLDAKPVLLLDHFADFPEDWAPKYIWNYYACLRAAINFWIRMKRLHMANPLDLVEIEPGTKVYDYVPTRSDFDAIYVTSFTLGLPDFVRRLYTSVYETGLRIGEILGWQIEEMSLAPPEFGTDGRPIRLPFFTTEISKQGKPVKVQIPMSRPLYGALVAQVGGRSHGSVWPIEQSKLYALLREHELLKRAGVPFTRPFHDFRKTVKHRLKIEKGLGRDVSKGFMGHKTDAMDDYCTHLRLFDLWSAVEDSWREKG